MRNVNGDTGQAANNNIPEKILRLMGVIFFNATFYGLEVRKKKRKAILSLAFRMAF
jgi:hypothetical protein